MLFDIFFLLEIESDPKMRGVLRKSTEKRKKEQEYKGQRAEPESRWFEEKKNSRKILST